MLFVLKLISAVKLSQLNNQIVKYAGFSLIREVKPHPLYIKVHRWLVIEISVARFS